MQTLGLSDSTPRSDSRLKSLFWPSIQNVTDVDYVTRQGFWLCIVVAVLTVGLGLVQGVGLAILLDGAFFALCGVGIRERSRVAVVAAFLIYLLAGFVIGARSIGIQRIVALALLASNVRAVFLVSRFGSDDLEEFALPRRVWQIIFQLRFRQKCGLGLNICCISCWLSNF
jgi:hypothetical protein